VWILEQAVAAMDAKRGVEKMVWVSDFKGTGMKYGKNTPYSLFIYLSISLLVLIWFITAVSFS
jgi:hypothetical protein